MEDTQAFRETDSAQGARRPTSSRNSKPEKNGVRFSSALVVPGPLARVSLGSPDRRPDPEPRHRISRFSRGHVEGAPIRPPGQLAVALDAVDAGAVVPRFREHGYSGPSAAGGSEPVPILETTHSAGRGERFVVGVLWNWLGVGAGLFTGLLLSPYLIRKLGPEAYGLWALAFAMVEYCVFLEAVQRYDLSTKPAIITTILRASGTAVLLYHGYGLVEIGILVVLSQTVGYALYFCAFRRIFPELRISTRYAGLGTLRKMASF